MKVRSLIGFIILFIAVFTHARSGLSEETRGISDNEIKIGVIYDQTGPATVVTLMATEAFRTTSAG